MLLHAAALARPTVELVAATLGDGESVLAALEGALREGVIELDERACASRIRCLPRFVTSGRRPGSAAPSTARLAGAVADVEEQARHLALAAAGPDAIAAARLEAAAGHAAARGATGAAAELAELAAG